MVRFIELLDTGKEDKEKKGVISEVKREVRPLYERGVNFIKTLSGPEIDLESGLKFIKEIIDDEEILLGLTEEVVRPVPKDAVLLPHPVNVAILSLKLGKALKYSKDQLLELGTAALLHDIGMRDIPLKVLCKQKKLNKEVLELIKVHPEVGRDIVKKEVGEAIIADAVFQEHERIGGQGYPQGLRGEQIHEYAKIIGLTDTYEALIHQRPYRSKLLPDMALMEIIDKHKEYFLPKLLKTFFQTVTPYPVGSLIILNNGQIGKVIATNSLQPLKPTIEVLYDEKGERLKSPLIITLSDYPLLKIVGFYNEKGNF